MARLVRQPGLATFRTVFPYSLLAMVNGDYLPIGTGKEFIHMKRPCRLYLCINDSGGPVHTGPPRRPPRRPTVSIPNWVLRGCSAATNRTDTR
jgi:hypothetical protein